MQLPQTDRISISLEGAILVATINSPPDNRLNAAFLRELGECASAFQDPGVRGIVFMGQGHVFSKGFDVAEIRSQAGQLRAESMRQANDLLTFLADLRKPVVAAIDGPCFGGGLELALACHVRVCSDKARLGLPELSAGIVPGLGGATRLCHVIGEARALEMMLLGDMIAADRAAEIGLVSRIFPRSDFRRKALSFVRTICVAPATALAELLDIVACGREHGDKAAIDRAAEAFRRLAAAWD